MHQHLFDSPDFTWNLKGEARELTALLCINCVCSLNKSSTPGKLGGYTRLMVEWLSRHRTTCLIAKAGASRAWYNKETRFTETVYDYIYGEGVYFSIASDSFGDKRGILRNGAAAGIRRTKQVDGCHPGMRGSLCTKGLHEKDVVKF